MKREHRNPGRRSIIRLAALSALFLSVILAGCGSKDAASKEGNSGDEKVESLTVSHDSGIYKEDKLHITIRVPEGYTVAYTDNGMTPSAENDTGEEKVEIDLQNDGVAGYLVQNRDRMLYPELRDSRLLEDASLPAGKVLRAAAVSSSGEITEAETRVYFLNCDFEQHFPNCLVVSLVTDPVNLLDYDTGILTPGRIYDEWKQTDKAREQLANDETWNIESNITQHGRDWERPCRIQIYDDQESPAAEIDAGMRMTGHASRAENQKSFNIFFRSDYGTKYLEYELFSGLSQYKSFRLRAGGNNTEWLKFKDAYLMELVEDRHFTEAMTRPAVLFLNGEYWGPYLLSEKITDKMLADHYDIDKDQVIMFKEGELEEGTDEDIPLYEELMSWADRDLSDPENWQKFCETMDIQSLADYCAVRIYFGDADWYPDKNDVLWRTRDTSFNSGRWQYVLYDVEFSSGLYGDARTSPATDHFSLAKENYPLFAAAMENADFREMFLAALEEIAVKNCEPGRAEDLLAEYVSAWKPLMPDYYKRFGNTSSLWDRAENDTRNFFNTRWELLRPFVENAG